MTKKKEPVKKQTFSYRADPKIVERVKDKLVKTKPRVTISEKIAEMLYDYLSR